MSCLFECGNDLKTSNLVTHLDFVNDKGNCGVKQFYTYKYLENHIYSTLSLEDANVESRNYDLIRAPYLFQFVLCYFRIFWL